MLDTPVVFMIFNRPDLTERVFAAIRSVQPKTLLVIADGPRLDKFGEAEKCALARSIIEKIDWSCELLTNFSDTNLGCRKRVSSGLNWAFSQVEDAIILEDDCLPCQSFFYFCQTLLEYYRDDQQIMMIGGNNFQNGFRQTPYSYYFSRYGLIWGWASWRRAWKHYDVEMKTWQDARESGLLSSLWENPEEQNYWMQKFDNTYEGKIDTWDYQWTYACWKHDGFSILPRVNLVSNIGFRADGTHTQRKSSLADFPTKDIWEINHPPLKTLDRETDRYTFNRVYREKISLISKVRRNLSPIKKLFLKGVGR